MLLAIACGLLLPPVQDAAAEELAEFPVFPIGLPFADVFFYADTEKIAEEAEQKFTAFASLGATLGTAWDPDFETIPSPLVAGHPKAADAGDVEGALVEMSFAFSGDCVPQRAVAIHPNQRLIFFATSGGTQGYVCAYRIDPVARTLSPAPGSPFPTGGEPADALAIDPSGKFLYSTADADSAVTAFSINAKTGALTRIVGSPFATAPNPSSAVIDPAGRFLYVATSANKTFAGTITAYAIDASTTGALTPIAGSPFQPNQCALSRP